MFYYPRKPWISQMTEKMPFKKMPRTIFEELDHNLWIRPFFFKKVILLCDTVTMCNVHESFLNFIKVYLLWINCRRCLLSWLCAFKEKMEKCPPVLQKNLDIFDILSIILVNYKRAQKSSRIHYIRIQPFWNFTISGNIYCTKNPFQESTSGSSLYPECTVLYFWG